VRGNVASDAAASSAPARRGPRWHARRTTQARPASRHRCREARASGRRSRDDRHRSHVRRREAVCGRTVEREVALSNAVALRIYAAAKERGLHVQFYRDDKFYVENDNAYAQLYARTSGTLPVIVPSLPAEFAGRDSTKVNVVTDPDKTAEVLALMERVCGPDAYVTRSNPEFVEMLDPAVDKGVALRLVAEHFGIPMDRVMAIGDSYNDLPLLRAAGFAVAMGSAPDELKAEADAVVGDVEHDGVAEAIERFVLQPTEAERAAR
jgi:hypothetical protein